MLVTQAMWRERRMWLMFVAAAALLCGLLQLLPSVFLERAVRREGNEFLLTQVTHHGDAAIFYLPATREVLDGHFPPIDLHIPENRRFLFLRPPVPQLLFAPFLYFADDASHAYMAAGFFFTVLMFALFYWMGVTFFRSRLGALLFAAIGVLTPAVVQLPRAFFTPQLFMDTIAKNFIPAVRTPIHQLFLARIEDPLLTLWLFLLALTLLYRFFRAPSPRSGLFFAFAAGLLLYVYLYYWLFSMALFGFLFAWRFFFGGTEKKLKPWLMTIAVVGALTIPYIFNFIAFGHLPQAAEQIARVGFEYGFGFRVSVWRDYAAYVLFGIAAFALFRRRDPELVAFFVASLMSMVLLWNLQLLVGWNIQPDHWPKAFSPPLYLFSAIILAELARRAHERVRSVKFLALAVSLWVILFSLLIGKKILNAAVFIRPGQEWITDYSFPKPIIRSWEWLNKSAPPEAVVLSPSFITAAYLTGYTSTNPYLPGFNSIALNKEFENRFLLMHKLFGTPPERVRWLLQYKKDPLTACSQPCAVHTALNLAKAPTFLYAQTFNVAMSVFDALTVDKADYSVPAAKINELMARYVKLQPRWEDFRGDYVYVGPWERELVPTRFFSEPALELKFSQNDIEIYRVRQ